MKYVAVSLAATLLVGITLAPSPALADGGGVRVPFSTSDTPAVAPEGEEAATPEIGFITSDSPGCYQPDPAVDRCVISFSRLWVDAGTNSLMTFMIELNGRLVARYGGFFQNSMDLSGPLLGQGIKVPCGRGNDGGIPGLGRKYNFTIRAQDSAALKAANYGTIYCPPFRGPLPLSPP